MLTVEIDALDMKLLITSLIDDNITNIKSFKYCTSDILNSPILSLSTYLLEAIFFLTLNFCQQIVFNSGS